MEKIDLAMQKAAVLTEALPYIQDFNGSTVLVKVGGSVMENEENLVSLLSDIAFMDAVGMRVVLARATSPEDISSVKIYFAWFSRICFLMSTTCPRLGSPSSEQSS